MKQFYVLCRFRGDILPPFTPTPPFGQQHIQDQVPLHVICFRGWGILEPNVLILFCWATY